METHVGRITHFYNHLYVAVLALTDELQIGDVVHILGHTTDFLQRIRSLEIEHSAVDRIGAGEEVALKVLHPVREGDAVLKLSGPEVEQLVLEEHTIIEDGL